MKTEHEETYYIAYGLCHQMKTANGSLVTRNDEIVWLSEEDGYRSCAVLKGNAKHFRSIEEIRKTWTEWDGHPWYYRLKESSIHIIEVHEKTSKEFIEKIV